MVYAAAAGEKVTLSGGRRLQGGRWGEVNGHKAWAVDIPEVKAGTLAVPAALRRRRAPAADEAAEARASTGSNRCPATPATSSGARPGGSSTPRATSSPAGATSGTWRSSAITKWLDNRLPIEGVDAKSRTVTFDRPSLFALLSGDKPGPYWVENVVEALDTPGQWYLDRPQGILYYLPRPGEEMRVGRDHRPASVRR